MSAAAICCQSIYRITSGSRGVIECVCAEKRLAARYAASCCQLLSQRTSYLIFTLTHTLSLTHLLPVGVSLARGSTWQRVLAARERKSWRTVAYPTQRTVIVWAMTIHYGKRTCRSWPLQNGRGSLFKATGGGLLWTTTPAQ